MNLKIFVLKFLRKIFSLFCKKKNRIYDLNSPQEASDCIYNLLMSPNPCMIARFGSTELLCYSNYYGIKQGVHLLDFLTNKQNFWWWQKNIADQMQRWSGFFPPTYENLEKYCEMLETDSVYLDVLGSWVDNEKYIEKNYPNASKTKLVYLEPYHSENPWTRALEGKKVLVVHPFAQQIESQYSNYRSELFENKQILPLFHLETIQAVQSLGGENNGFNDWFDALKWMENEIDKHDYDICIIGCGAYGFNLAAHCKRMGKKAVHLGGALQLLFGIKGGRWEDEDYADNWGLPHDAYLKLLSNKYWIRPGNQGKPKNAKQVENGCYW